MQYIQLDNTMKAELMVMLIFDFNRIKQWSVIEKLIFEGIFMKISLYILSHCTKCYQLHVEINQLLVLYPMQAITMKYFCKILKIINFH